MELTLQQVISEWGTDFWIPALITAVIAYFCGCFNGAVIVSKYILRNDVRNHGSGNAGLTNFHRVFGGPLTAVVILTDVLKAVVALLVGAVIFRRFVFNGADIVVFAKYWAALFCLLGHMYPFYLKFKGGKGFAAYIGMMLALNWKAALVIIAALVVLTVVTDYIVVGTVTTVVTYPAFVAFYTHSVVAVCLLLVATGAILYKHRGNCVRILNGTEPGLRGASRGDFRK